MVLPLYFSLLGKEPSFFEKDPGGQTLGQFCAFVPAGMDSDISGVLGSVGPWEEGMNRGIRAALEVGRGRHWGSSLRVREWVGGEEAHSSILCQTLAQCMDTQRDYVNTGLKI